jgi:hypothetical protein
MVQKIAYDPKARTKEGIFVGLVLNPVGGVRSSNSILFHINIGIYWYLRRQ